MRKNRNLVLFTLALLTICFLGAAYAVWLNELPQWVKNVGRLQIVSAGGSATPDGNFIATSAAPTRAPAVHLTVTESGIAAVNVRQLRAANLDFNDFAADGLSLTHDGRPVPFYVVGEGDNATLYFFAQAQDNPLAPANVYVLRAGQGEAMARRDAQPSAPGLPHGWLVEEWEENDFFVEQARGDDAWMGPKLISATPWSHTLTTAADVEAARLIVHLFSESDMPGSPDHYVEIWFNGRLLASHAWNGAKHETVTLDVERSLLRPDGKNTVTLVTPAGDASENSGDHVYLNKIRLEYLASINIADQQLDFRTGAANVAIAEAGASTLVFDITDKAAPVLLTNLHYEDDQLHFAGDGDGREYIALQIEQTVKPTVSPVPQWPHSLRDAQRGADYLMIVAEAPGMLRALDPLVHHRETQGLQVDVVPLAQIYDEFGYGQHSPEAIRQFLTYTAEAWRPVPRYVLLVGDATYDLNDQMLSKNHNLLPAPLVYTTSGYTASDRWYTQPAALNAPPMMIGRFPVQNAGQLQTIVTKTIAYEQRGLQPAWRARALLIADTAGEFEQASGDLAATLHTHGYKVNKLFMSYGKNIQHDILSAINQGVGVVNYLGDGSKSTWGDEAVLQSSDAPLLRNGDRLPILTTFTCSSGAFADPYLDTLAESLLRVGNGGIVAAVAPSGRAPTEQQLLLADRFYAALLDADTDTLGEAMLILETSATADSAAADVLTTMNLLGDPALRLQKP